MKNIAAIAIIAAVSAGPAHAAGFQPWSQGRPADRVDSQQTTVIAKPYYREQTPVIEDRRTSEQGNVVIKPWYAKGSV